jgi:hypothetical protein
MKVLRDYLIYKPMSKSMEKVNNLVKHRSEVRAGEIKFSARESM